MCKCQNLKFYAHNFDLPVIFKCQDCGKFYMCKCQKYYYDIIYSDYKRKLKRKDIKTYSSGKTKENEFVELYENAKFKNNICHICKNLVPPYYNYSGLSQFAKRYFPYIDAIVLAYFNGSYLNDECTDLKISYSIIEKVEKNAEDEIREKANYPLKTDKWLNEKFLYKICCVVFDSIVIRQYSPSWLDKLRLDIYIPEYKLGIEYQGEQHYKPIEFFGGKENLKKQQERDKRKASLCKIHGVKLIYFNYNEELTEEKVIRKIKKYITLK